MFDGSGIRISSERQSLFQLGSAIGSESYGPAIGSNKIFMDLQTFLGCSGLNGGLNISRLIKISLITCKTAKSAKINFTPPL